MHWPDLPEPARMLRVAVVAPEADLPAALECLRTAGCADLDRDDGSTATAGQDRSVEELLDSALRADGVGCLRGWVAASERDAVAAQLAPCAASLVTLPRPAGVDPPTLLSGHRLTRAFAPLVTTYATIPYEDVDPSALAGFVYVVMFGMMFADAGHGAMLVAAGLVLRAGRPRSLARARRVWPVLVGAGLAGVVFGALYGELFGPTRVLPVVWMEPLDHPVQLMAVGIAVGAVLLTGSYAVGTVNRVREHGWAAALLETSGLAGAGLFLGLGLGAGGWYLGDLPLAVGGIVVAAASLGAATTGFYIRAGGGGAAATQAGVESFDLLLRLVANLVSFARLAAFGLTHAALGAVVWDATSALVGRGPAGAVAAGVVFVVGNAVAFALEGLIAGVQALRLEYYELFSRIFATEGRAFRPWGSAPEPGGDLS